MDPDACFSMILENIVHSEWHDAGESFGTDVSNGRLIYLTGFNVVE